MDQSSRTQPCRAAFTLIEMLMVMGLIMLLMALVMGGVGRAKKVAYKVRAKDEMLQIKTAWVGYLNDHKKWPPNAASFKQMKGDPVYLLRGQLSGLTAEQQAYVKANNRRLSMYLEVTEATESGDTEQDNELLYGMKDPWGTVFQLRLDHDLNNRIATPYGEVTNVVALWSAGRDRKEGTDDDIKEWEK